MVLITIVTGAYKPTYNWGASHCNQPTIHFSLFKNSTNHSLFILSLYLSSMLKRPDIWPHFFFWKGSSPPSMWGIPFIKQQSQHGKPNRAWQLASVFHSWYVMVRLLDGFPEVPLLLPPDITFQWPTELHGTVPSWSSAVRCVGQRCGHGRGE